MNEKLEKLKNELSGKNVTVIGIGVSNTPVIDFLLSCGAFVTARDKKNEDELGDVAKSLKDKGVKLVLGEKYLENIEAELILKTPGIRFDEPNIQKAVKNGAVLSSEMELFFETCPSKIFAVTGSDGKTTTTTLISEMLKAEAALRRSEAKVFLGGNIGKPLLPEIESIGCGDFCVLELSSFQLHTMKKSPDVAIITNISPNHLNWHTDMDEYIEAKRNIGKYQNENGRIVLNADNDITASMINSQKGKVSVFSTSKEPKFECAERCAFLRGDDLIVKDGDGEHFILSEKDIKLPGIHNVQNYMAAILALWGYVSQSAILKVAKEFGGVEHRLEFVREKGEVKYYNSSIDTSPTRTAAALNSFDRRVIVICGGYDKHIPFEPLADVLISKAKSVILTGATAQKIEDTVLAHPDFDLKKLPIYREKEFKDAVTTASKIAQKGDIVILSPACASFDAFENFAARGRFFKTLVNEL